MSSEKKYETNSFTIFDRERNIIFANFNDVKDVSIESEIKENFPYDEDKKILSFESFKTPIYEMSFTLDKPISMDNFTKLFSDTVSDIPKAYDIQFVKVVQVRKHKKNRVNKKWIKRYGYRTIFLDSKGWKMENYSDGTFKFTK